MAVKIRLARSGKKKNPYYQIVAADVRSPRDGRFIKQIGTYNPLLEKSDPNWVKIDVDAAKYWLSVGAKPTERVGKLFAQKGVNA